MHKALSLNEILETSDCDLLVGEFYFFLVEKRLKHTLNEIEEVVYLLLGILPSIEMEGFIDLFHQVYSLRECLIVEKSLRQFELNKLADLFSEGKSIYTNGNLNITQEEYEKISLGAFDEIQDRRFDEIGDIVLANDSEIYRLGDRLCEFIRSNGEFLVKNNAMLKK